MRIDLPYRKDTIAIELDSKRVAGILEPNEVESLTAPAREVRKVLDNPGGRDGYADFLTAPGSLLVIVNDGSRPTPTRYVLESIADELEAADAHFIIATGVHRAPTAEEYRYIFGSSYERFASKIYVHDARNDDMVSLGFSRNGTELRINRIGYEADKLLIIGSVEPHYFAGYTGGRKGILPGIAAYSTIEQNHKHALSPKAASLALSGNPVHEDMVDALGMVKNSIYTVMTVLDKHQELYAITAGDINEAFGKAVEKADEVFVVQAREKADVVVSCARYPMDIDLYQAQKAIENGKLVLKKGGTLILVAACRDGIGESAFSDLLASSHCADAVLQKIADGYRLGYHKAGKIAELLQWANIEAFTELEDTQLERIFIKPVHDLQEAVESALESHGPGAKVLFLPDGSVTVPRVG